MTNNFTDKRLRVEMAELASAPPPFTSAAPREGNLRVWDAEILGPIDTPYEMGKFYLKLEIPEGYPFVPPKVTFKTKIFYCNINTIGQVCLDILKTIDDQHGKWKSAMGIASVLVSIHQLLSDPNPDDPLMLSVAQLYKTNRPEHDRRAKLWTQRFAS